MRGVEVLGLKCTVTVPPERDSLGIGMSTTGTVFGLVSAPGDVTAPGEYIVHAECDEHAEGHEVQVPESWVTFDEDLALPEEGKVAA